MVGRKRQKTWRSEEAFVETLLRLLRAEAEATRFIREFRTGYGLPDLLSVEYCEDIVSRRKRRLDRSRLEAFTIDCAYTMAYLSNRRWMQLPTLKARVGLANGPFFEAGFNIACQEAGCLQTR